MPNITTETNQNARHLAARAIMAYRAGFPIERISISAKDSGIISDWKRLRSSYNNDDKLIRRGFAFAYWGSQNQAGAAISSSA